VRLLLDENLSPALVEKLAADYPYSLHVRSVALRGKEDTIIWEYAGRNNLLIVSKDNDFRQLSFLKGPPPKVIWLSVGNADTETIARLLCDRLSTVKSFEVDPYSALLPLELNDDMS
jgi:predicted nuclease of predicted toxin-antitoxin system